MRYTVLIVDDELHGRENLTYMVNNFLEDVEVIEVSDNLTDAFNKVNLLKPDIIFLDIHIGEENGLDLLSQKITYKPAVIIVSGYAEYGIKAVKKGVVDYLLKPISIDELIEAVSKAKLYVDQNRVYLNEKNQKLHIDQLLENVFPEEAIPELIESGKVEPKIIPNATVVFADFKGFTFIAENMSSIKLIQKLDQYFAHFDEIVTSFHLDKIKTMGDGYLFAGGIHGKFDGDAIRCVQAAINMQRFVKTNINNDLMDGKDPWELRIGIHTGEVVAGVIGKTKLAYDIWGDTVNYANRIQSICKPGKIAISSTTAALIEGKIEFESGGRLTAKNMEEFEVFYIKQDL